MDGHHPLTGAGAAAVDGSRCEAGRPLPPHRGGPADAPGRDEIRRGPSRTRDDPAGLASIIAGAGPDIHAGIGRDSGATGGRSRAAGQPVPILFLMIAPAAGTGPGGYCSDAVPEDHVPSLPARPGPGRGGADDARANHPPDPRRESLPGSSLPNGPGTAREGPRIEPRPPGGHTGPPNPPRPAGRHPSSSSRTRAGLIGPGSPPKKNGREFRRNSRAADPALEGGRAAACPSPPSPPGPRADPRVGGGPTGARHAPPDPPKESGHRRMGPPTAMAPRSSWRPPAGPSRRGAI